MDGSHLLCFCFVFAFVTLPDFLLVEAEIFHRLAVVCASLKLAVRV